MISFLLYAINSFTSHDNWNGAYNIRCCNYWWWMYRIDDCSWCFITRIQSDSFWTRWFCFRHIKQVNKSSSWWYSLSRECIQTLRLERVSSCQSICYLWFKWIGSSSWTKIHASECSISHTSYCYCSSRLILASLAFYATRIIFIWSNSLERRFAKKVFFFWILGYE